MMDEYICELLSAVMSEVQKKYRYMSEVHRLTKELGEGLSGDDNLVAHMVLEMRGSELEKIRDCDICIRRLIPDNQENIQEKIDEVLNGIVPADIRDEEEYAMWRQIADTTQATKRIWMQTVESDRALSRRLAGSDSFYC